MRVDYPYIDRCMVHFERGDWDLFDKASPPDRDTEISPRQRAISLQNAIRAGLSYFTLTPESVERRVRQRWIIARARCPELISDLADVYVRSGRMLKLWKELREIRRKFLDVYNEGLHLIVQVNYWREEVRDLAELEVTIKKFDLFGKST